jgi:hypothetical protein
MLHDEERRIINDLQSLRASEPDEAADKRVVAEVRATIIRRNALRRSSWVRKIAMPAGIAAAIAMSLSIVLFTIGQQPASAAEALAEIVEINQTYKGWVHVSTWSNNKKGGERKERYRIHHNTVDGTHISETIEDDYRGIVYKNPTLSQESWYRSDWNEIRICDLHPGEVDGQRRLVSINMYISIDKRLERYSTRLADDDISNVRRTREGNLDRHEINWAYKSSSARPADEAPQSITLWADPKSKLITQVRGFNGHDSVYTYGEPFIASIYDLDVPRDAKVIANRLAGEVKQVIDRLDQRINRNFADGLAVMITTSTRITHGVEEKHNELCVFARRGDMFLRAEYDLSEPLDDRRSITPLPDGWPDPGSQSVVKFMRKYIPLHSTFYNNGWKWRLIRNRQGIFMGPPSRSDPRNWRHDMTRPGMFEQLLAWANLAGEVWQGRYRLNLYSPQTTMELIENTTTRQTLRKMEISRGERAGWDEETYEFDPSRDDMPLSYEDKWFSRAVGNDTPVSEITTRWLEFAQLPDGRWYPTRWQKHMSHVRINATAVKDVKLNIDPTVVLDEVWFTMPSQRFGVGTVKTAAPAASQPSQEQKNTK